jgi:hypothetical protein
MWDSGALARAGAHREESLVAGPWCLVAGSDIEFRERGVATLTGIPGQRQLFTVERPPALAHEPLVGGTPASFLCHLRHRSPTKKNAITRHGRHPCGVPRPPCRGSRRKRQLQAIDAAGVLPDAFERVRLA